MRKRFSFIIALLVPLLLLSCFSCNKHKPIRLYHGSWESIWIVNEITAYLIQNGYGYPVEYFGYNEYEFREGFHNAEIDLAMEMWEVNFIDMFEKQTATGDMVWLGDIYESGPQYWMIPKWVADEFEIRSVMDMKEHWRLFQNPRNPTKGAFYNCIIGWDCLEINRQKMHAYGLDKYYDIINPGTAEMLEAAFIDAQENHVPVFGYYWAPTPLMGEYDWYILEEPPYSKECWLAIGKAMKNGTMNGNACAYEATPVRKVAHKRLLKNAPDVVEMVKKVKLDVSVISQIMAWAKSRNERDWKKVAIHFLKNNEDTWKAWVTPAAREKVLASLARESA